MGYKALVRSKSILVELAKRSYCTTAPNNDDIIQINSRSYTPDEFTNVSPKILTYVNRNLHLQKKHPLCLVREKIVDYFYKSYLNVKGSPVFSVYDRLSPVVTVKQNFDDLLIPPEHPSRAKSDCYYVNKSTLLRAHTTAHQTDLIRSGLDNFLVVGEVYRRDAIDSTHFPVFHQMDALRSQTREQLFPDQPDLDIFERRGGPEGGKQPCHTLEAVKVMEYQLKHALVGMVKSLFGENIDYRWVDTEFPFTQPSWELEVFWNNDWMEVLGCGIVRQEIMTSAGSANSVAYAFGMGLERLAMALYNIPDIRLFWSEDSGFLNQFKPKDPKRIIKYRPISIFPQCTNDLSFWLPDEKVATYSDNDLYDIVRDIGGDLIEQVELTDKFIHPKTGRSSRCYSIVYRHMERTLTQEEVNAVHKKIEEAVTTKLKAEMR